VFFSKSNFKYKFVDALVSFIHYGPDIGVDASLQLDAPILEIAVEWNRQMMVCTKSSSPTKIIRTKMTTTTRNNACIIWATMRCTCWEINHRMLLPQANLKFAPIALHPELEQNATTILQTTNMDQVRYSLSGSEAMECDEASLQFIEKYHYRYLSYQIKRIIFSSWISRKWADVRERARRLDAVRMCNQKTTASTHTDRHIK
jgi:hypothetical protein